MSSSAKNDQSHRAFMSGMNQLMLLPTEVIMDMIKGADFDQWTGFLSTNRRLREIAQLPSVMRTIVIRTKNDFYKDGPGLRTVGSDTGGGELFRKRLIMLANAGNLGAQVRLVLGYTMVNGQTFVPEGLVNEYVQNPKTIPYLMWRLSTPYVHNGKLARIHTMLQPEAASIYNRAEPFPHTLEPKSLPTLRMEPAFFPCVMEWLAEVCVTIDAPEIYGLAGYIYAWYIANNTVHRTKLQLHMCAAIIIAGRTCPKLNEPDSSAVGERRLIYLTADTYTHDELLHCITTVLSQLPPVSINIRMPYENLSDTINIQHYMWPSYYTNFWTNLEECMDHVYVYRDVLGAALTLSSIGDSVIATIGKMESLRKETSSIQNRAEMWCLKMDLQKYLGDFELHKQQYVRLYDAYLSVASLYPLLTPRTKVVIGVHDTISEVLDKAIKVLLKIGEMKQVIETEMEPYEIVQESPSRSRSSERLTIKT